MVIYNTKSIYMKKVNIQLVALSILLITFTTTIKSQVTIGSVLEPVQGALLDLKEHNASEDNVTATHGLVLPRVVLTDLNSLKDITGAGNDNNEAYAGLLVYNVNQVEDPCGGSIPLGLYVWDGTQWVWQHGTIESQGTRKAFLGDLQALQAIKDANAGNTIKWTIDLANSTYTDPDKRLTFGGEDCENQRLIGLDCSGNNVTTLNVAPFDELLTLNCETNNISTLNVKQNSKLKILNCNNNHISQLDVTQNRDLEELLCNDNSFNNQGNLNLTQNVKLTHLECKNNQFQSLNISQNRALVTVDCSNNKLDALDVTQHPSLVFLDCSKNNLSSINMLQSRLLRTLYCNNNKLTQLNITHNPVLEAFNATNNQALNQGNGSTEVCTQTWNSWANNPNILPARDNAMYKKINCN